MSEHLDYATFMRQHAYRVTPQRQLILDAIGERNGPSTFDDIYGRVRARSSAVNRATVYEIAGDTPHHHLVCLRCRQVWPLSHETVKELFAIIEREQHFHVETDHLALFGLCQQCYQADPPAVHGIEFSLNDPAERIPADPLSTELD